MDRTLHLAMVSHSILHFPVNSADATLGWLSVVANGVPSVAQKVMVGNGAAPPFDARAHAK